MSDFTYTARDQQGTVQTGRLEALNEDQVVAMLQHRGLLVVSISRKDLAPSLSKPQQRTRVASRTHQRVTTEDQVLLCQQLATLVEAGVPLLRSLAVVTAQVESRQLRSALEEVYRDVEGGQTLRQALAKHPAIFSNLWLNLVETGEASGHLAQSLQQLARHFESVRHLKNQTVTALTYPAFLIATAVCVMGVFVYWLIPKFSVFFASMHVELPLLTRVMIAVSDGARRYFVVTLMGAVALAFMVRRYLRTDAGQWMRDQLFMRLPLLNTLFIYVQLAGFSRGLSTLLEAGVPLLSSLEILERSSTNKIYGQAIGVIKASVKEGKPMTEPMVQTGLFPPMAVQMIQVGEEVGELARMADRTATYYEESVETYIARMTRLFEPIAIVIMGILVLIVVLSIFMPIFKMAGGAGLHG